MVTWPLLVIELALVDMAFRRRFAFIAADTRLGKAFGIGHTYVTPTHTLVARDSSPCWSGGEGECVRAPDGRTSIAIWQIPVPSCS